MSFRRTIIETIVRAGCGFGPSVGSQPENPSSVFVLRNNDIGDLLIVTPLFEALKRLFPQAQIVAGIGSWNQDVMRNNPWVDRVVRINAPFHNKQLRKHRHNSPLGFAESLRYIFTSEDVRHLRSLRCDIGIDVLGSPEGSLLMTRAGIPWRLGVKGYAGGQGACQQYVTYDERIQVGRASLGFAELLGASSLPESRPQLFLTGPEKEQALMTWNALGGQNGTRSKRIVIAPGGGIVEKCWPRENYRLLAAQLARQPNAQIVIVGGPADHELGEFVRGGCARIVNLCGKTSLRETFALVWSASGVACNGSMILHTAAAFNIPTVVLLGSTFASARHHKQLWGYGAHDLHLGRELEGDKICSAEEAMVIIKSHFQLD